MKLYIVRHGQTEENANNCLVGRINSSLNEFGKKGAIETKDYFKDREIDLIISSPLNRCKETAEIISDDKIKVVYSDKLLGRDHGEFTGVSRDKMDFDEYWNYNKNIKYQKAESVRDLYDRAVNLIKELKKMNYENIILVTHSGIIRVLYYYFNGIPENGILSEVTIKNCEVFEYDL